MIKSRHSYGFTIFLIFAIYISFIWMGGRVFADLDETSPEFNLACDPTPLSLSFTVLGDGPIITDDNSVITLVNNSYWPVVVTATKFRITSSTGRLQLNQFRQMNPSELQNSNDVQHILIALGLSPGGTGWLDTPNTWYAPFDDTTKYIGTIKKSGTVTLTLTGMVKNTPSRSFTTSHCLNLFWYPTY